MEMGSHQFIDVSQVFSKYYYFLLKDLKSNGCREKKCSLDLFLCFSHGKIVTMDHG